jgi:hypothetical protein
VPPGYFIQSANAAPTAMAQCGPGLYRERWVMFADPRALNCTACGQGIQSEPRDLDENPLAVNGSLVRATSTSCCECRHPPFSALHWCNAEACYIIKRIDAPEGPERISHARLLHGVLDYWLRPQPGNCDSNILRSSVHVASHLCLRKCRRLVTSKHMLAIAAAAAICRY